MNEEDIKKLIDTKIAAAMNFGVTKYGDTPTDALQLTPKKYVDANSATPGGSDTQIQFNDGGSFGGDANFYYDSSGLFEVGFGDGFNAEIALASGAGGDIDLVAGNATAVNDTGGDVFLNSGNAFGSGGAGGQMFIQAGDGNGAGHGGSIDIISGDGGASGGDGGNIEIDGGNGQGSGNGGTINIKGGNKDTSGIIGDVTIGRGTTTTSRTSDFLFIPTSAGTPSGTPITNLGLVAICYDTTNNKLYIYNGAWKSVTLT